MKKIKRLLIVVMFALILASCGEGGTKHVKVTFEANGGEMSTTVMQAECGKTLTLPADPTKAGYEFAGWFIDAEFTTAYDNSKLVESGFTLYAKWESKEVEVYVTSVRINSGYLAYETNKSSEGKDEKMQFIDDEVAYSVGDDNAWSAKPEVGFSFVNEFGVFENIEVEEWEYEIKVSLKTEDGYVDIATLEEKYLDKEVDTKNVLVDFSEAAIGKEFLVSVVPTGLTEKQLADIATYRTEYEILIVNGFNVYNELELSYLENRAVGEQATAWKAFKEKHGIDPEYHPTSIVLHQNLNLLTEHVPSFFFYQASELSSFDADYEKALGSAKDYEEIFVHELADNEEFTVHGNYFNLDCSNLREVVREDGDIDTDGLIISHAVFLRFKGAESGKSRFENISIVGNAARVEDPKKSGGHIFVKVTGPKFDAYNVISSCFFIVYYPELTNQPFTMTKCRAYDSFNSFIYIWGSKGVTIDQCVMKSAGGPVILQDHVDVGEPTSRSSSIEIKNSTLESYVAGTEGWFTIVGAAAVIPQIKALDAWFNAFGKSFLKKGPSGDYYMNFVALNKSGNAQSVTAEKVDGSIKIDDLPAFDYGLTNPYVKAMLDTTFGVTPAFQTSASTLEAGYGFLYQNPDILPSPFVADVVNKAPIMDPTNAIYQGDYLTIYFNGMAIVLGYGPAGESL